MERQSTSVVAGVAALCVGTFFVLCFVFCGERGIESSNSPSALEEMVNPSLLRLAMVMFQTSTWLLAARSTGITTATNSIPRFPPFAGQRARALVMHGSQWSPTTGR